MKATKCKYWERTTEIREIKDWELDLTKWQHKLNISWFNQITIDWKVYNLVEANLQEPDEREEVAYSNIKTARDVRDRVALRIKEMEWLQSHILRKTELENVYRMLCEVIDS